MAITYVSWNIKQLGQSKMKPTSEFDGVQSVVAIANNIKQLNADIVMVMEVTLKEYGTDVVKLIGETLGKGYGVGATPNSATAKPDRYAFIWKEDTVFLKAVGYPQFIDAFNNPVTFPNRYPALLEFVSLSTKTQFGVMILHGPEPQEVTGGGPLQAMTSLANLAYVQNPPLPMIISGDFNVDYNLNTTPYDNFETLKYSVLFKGNKTSLKMKFETIEDPGTYLKSAYDNIFLSPALAASASGVSDFILATGNKSGLPAYDQCTQTQKDTWQTILSNGRNRLSDHLPVWCSLPI